MIEIFTTPRTRILMNLRERPHTVSEIAKKTGYSKATVSYHLAKLTELGMVERNERGKWVYYRLTDKGFRSIRTDIAAVITSICAAVVSFVSIIWKFMERGEVVFTAEKAPAVRGVEGVVGVAAYDLTLLLSFAFLILSLTVLLYIRFIRFSNFLKKI